MPPLYTLVAADDSPRRDRLLALLAHHAEAQIAGPAETALGLSRALRTDPVDVVFLDAALPPDGGQAALERLDDDLPPALVVTGAEPGDGLWAYAVGAVDCLTCPLAPDRLAEAMRRATAHVVHCRIRARRDDLIDLLDGTDATRPAPASDAPLVVRSGSQLVFLDPAEIDWVEAAGVYVSIHVGGTRHLVRESLRHVEERLDPARFVRIHRSTVLNVDRVRKIVPHPNGGAVVVLKDGAQLKMSRSYRERIHAALG